MQKYLQVFLVSGAFLALLIFPSSTGAQEPISASLIPTGAIEQIQFFAKIGCERHGCDPKAAEVIAIGVFYQECGGRPSCEAKGTFVGSFQQSTENYKEGIGYFVNTYRHDPKLVEVIVSLHKRKGGDLKDAGRAREDHTLATAAWFGNNIRFIDDIQRVTQNSTEQAAIGMMLQLMPSQTRKALWSKRAFGEHLLSSGNAGRLSKSNSIPVRSGERFASVVAKIGSKYQLMRKGVAVALGREAPEVSTVTEQLRNFQQVFTETLGSGRLAGQLPAQNAVTNFLGLTSGNALGGGLTQFGTNSGGSSGTTRGSSGGTQTTFNRGGSFPTLSTPTTNEQGILSALGNTVDNLLSGSSGNADGSTENRQRLSGNEPTLLCLPNPVAEGEEALIVWACRDDAHTTTGSSVDTQGRVIGKAIVTPSQTTTYGVTCVSAERALEAQCTVVVAQPALAIAATPNTVLRGGTVQLSWRTKDVNSCVVSARELPTLQREGVNGTITTPAVTETTTFTLTCESATGTIVEESTTVTLE